MAKSRKTPELTSEDVREFADAVRTLAANVRQLCLIMDEVREDLVFAVRNDHFESIGHERYDEVLARVERLLGSGEAVDGARDRMPFEPPPVKPTARPPGSLFE